MPLASTFWDAFFLLFIFLPLLLVWAFALYDIFSRKDMSGPWKAIWVLCVILVPFVGTIVYLVFRRPGIVAEADEAPGDTKYMLRTLDDLHRRGKLSDEEYAAEKARVLAG